MKLQVEEFEATKDKITKLEDPGRALLAAQRLAAQGLDERTASLASRKSKEK